MGEFSSITRTGKHEPFDLHVARGYIQGHGHVNKFGFNPDMGGGGSLETIWDGSNLYTYATSAAVVSVAGTDNGSITIEGLDANYVSVTENVSIGAVTTQEFYRINRAYVTNLASGSINSANINMNIDGNLRSRITASRGQTLQAVYTVPAGHTAYLKNVHFGTEEADKKGFFILASRHVNDGGVFNTKGFFGADQSVDYEYTIPLKFEEKTDIEVRADIQSSEGASAIFDMILIKNESV